LKDLRVRVHVSRSPDDITPGGCLVPVVCCPASPPAVLLCSPSSLWPLIWTPISPADSSSARASRSLAHSPDVLLCFFLSFFFLTFSLLHSLGANRKTIKKNHARHAQEQRTLHVTHLRTANIVLSLNICVENNSLPRLLTVVSRIYADTHCSGRVRNTGTKNPYPLRLIIILNRTKGYIHGLCAQRAHAKSDTPNNNSVHTTLQKSLHSHRHICTPGKIRTVHPPFPLIRLSFVIAVASILLTLFSIVTNTIKRHTPITQYTNLPSLIFSGVGKKHSRPSGTLPPTPDPKSKNISSPSFPDKNKKKRQKHQSQDKKDLVSTEKTAQKQKSTTPVIKKKHSPVTQLTSKVSQRRNGLHF